MARDSSIGLMGQATRETFERIKDTEKGFSDPNKAVSKAIGGMMKQRDQGTSSQAIKVQEDNGPRINILGLTNFSDIFNCT